MFEFITLLALIHSQAWASEAIIRKTNRIPQHRPRTDRGEGGKGEGQEGEEEEEEEDDDDEVVAL